MKRTGFTLIELLVTVVVIAMLAGMLMVGVQAARQAAQRAQCQNNQRELGKAMIGFATANKGLPGYVNNIAGKPLSWGAVLLPNIGENGRYETILEHGTGTSGDAILGLGIFVCPLAGKSSASEPALSYVVNCGTWDSKETPAVAKYALFQDRRGSSSTAKVSLDADGIPDGLGSTILMSENLQADRWFRSAWDAGDSGDDPDDNNPTKRNIAYGGFVWSHPNETTRTPNNGVLRINKDISGFPSDDLDRFNKYARPASNHPGVVMALYADGSVKTVDDDVEEIVYFRAVCPNDAKACQGMGW